MTRVKVYSVLICLTLLCLTANVRADAVFTFDNTPIGTQTPFSITNNGLTAQFSSDGAFEVASQSEMQFAAPFNGNYLLDSPEADGSFLEIDFSAQVTGASMDFATDDPAESQIEDSVSPDFGGFPSTIELLAFNDGTEVGGSSSTGEYPGGFDFPQGTVGISGVSFNTLIVFDNDTPAFALDNISVTGNATSAPAGVPEVSTAGFGSLAIILFGTLALLEGARSKSRQA